MEVTGEAGDGEEAIKLIRTVQGQINSIFHKLRVGSRTEPIFQSVRKGWLSFEDLG